MHARITWGTVKPGHWEEYEAAYRQEVLSREKPAGLRGRMLVRDSDDQDSGATVSLWDSEADMLAYEQGALTSRVLPALEQHLIGKFHTHRCEVRHLGLID
ncbi:MAG TPA: antibiotic biosynthesis monooxygenase [Candidatus Acidoferrum sp.]|nr:antibiotic biosynthesis monooxygenase [Candidatus Acidoferrum sp.]